VILSSRGPAFIQDAGSALRSADAFDSGGAQSRPGAVSGLTDVAVMDGGWRASAGAWIASLGEEGDFTRRYVTDAAMVARIEGRAFDAALDVGCGEGRFCRILRQLGIAVTGVDPTPRLIDEAVRRDPSGDYRIGHAEALEFPDAGFDLVVSYLTLIDIPGLEEAISEMARVLAPGGALLIANLASFSTAGVETGWDEAGDGTGLHFVVDRYLEERAIQVEWEGIRIVNWHRPLSRYLGLLLEQGLRLVHFAEPRASGPNPEEIRDYERAPWAYVMEWRKD
jgi:SAM-dependent methyltransferase